MNAIVNKILSARNKSMPEMHLKWPGFTYSASGPFTKIKKWIKRLERIETEDSRYIYQNELDKACSQQSMAYGDFKYLNTRAVIDKALHDKVLKY